MKKTMFHAVAIAVYFTMHPILVAIAPVIPPPPIPPAPPVPPKIGVSKPTVPPKIGTSKPPVPPKIGTPAAPAKSIAKSTAKAAASSTTYTLSIGDVHITNLSNQDATLNAMTMAYSVNDKNISTQSKFSKDNTIPANTAGDLRSSPNILTFSPSITITAPVGTKIEFTGITQLTINNQVLKIAEPLKTNVNSASTVASRYYIKKVKGKWKLIPQEQLSADQQPTTGSSSTIVADTAAAGTADTSPSDVGTTIARNAAAATLLNKEHKLPEHALTTIANAKKSDAGEAVDKALSNTASAKAL